MRNLADILLPSKLQALCRGTSTSHSYKTFRPSPVIFGQRHHEALSCMLNNFGGCTAAKPLQVCLTGGSLPLRLIYTTYNHVTRKKVFPLYYQKDCVLTWRECDNECSHGDSYDNVLFLWSHEEFIQVKMKEVLSLLCTVAVNRNVIPRRPSLSATSFLDVFAPRSYANTGLWSMCTCLV